MAFHFVSYGPAALRLGRQVIKNLGMMRHGIFGATRTAFRTAPRIPERCPAFRTANETAASRCHLSSVSAKPGPRAREGYRQRHPGTTPAKKLVSLTFCAAALATPTFAECRLALALGLDVSGSVDAQEYRLQMTGLANALTDEAVQNALFAAPGFWVSVAVYEWSSSSYQNMVVEWTDLTDEGVLADVTATLRAHQREPAPQATGLGAAMQYGTTLLDQRTDCWDRTLDLSGDGKNNDWPVPQRLRRDGELGEHRINALAVATSRAGRELDIPPPGVAELTAYFDVRVKHGPGSFVEVALGYKDYERAMRRKLLREIATLPLGMTPPPPRRLVIADRSVAQGDRQ